MKLHLDARVRFNLDAGVQMILHLDANVHMPLILNAGVHIAIIWRPKSKSQCIRTEVSVLKLTES